MVYGLGSRVWGLPKTAPVLHTKEVRERPRGMQQAVLEYNHFTELCSGSEAGSYLRIIDSCITQLKARGPSRTCNESKEEEYGGGR